MRLHAPDHLGNLVHSATRLLLSAKLIGALARGTGGILNHGSVVLHPPLEDERRPHPSGEAKGPGFFASL